MNNNFKDIIKELKNLDETATPDEINKIISKLTSEAPKVVLDYINSNNNASWIDETQKTVHKLFTNYNISDKLEYQQIMLAGYMRALNDIISVVEEDKGEQ